MGLALMVLSWVGNRIDQTRIGHIFVTGIATVVIALAFVVATICTTMLTLAFLGYYP